MVLDADRFGKQDPPRIRKWILQMNPASKSAVTAGAIALCGFAAFFVSHHRPAPTLSTPAPAVSPTEGAGEVLKSSSKQPQSASAMKIGDPLSEPKNVQEVAWLTRNGYPTQGEVQAAMDTAATSAQLDIGGGVTPTRIIQAETLAISDPNRRNEAIGYLSDAAKRGSIYALEGLARVTGHPALNNPVRSEAYWRAAQMRGDWAAGMTPRLPLSNEDSALASLMAQQILNQINGDRRTHGLPSLGQDPRPGLNELLRQIAESRGAGRF